MSRIVPAAAILFTLSSPVSSLDLSDYRIVDLTHPYNAETIYWPTSPSRFELMELAYGETPGGWFYSAYALCTPEHGGIHFDAPVHFSANGAPVHKVPLNNIIAPAVTIDVSAQAAEDSNYRLTVNDVLGFEALHGEIEAGTIVLLRTDWSERWPDTAAYMGDDTPGDASRLSFPGYGAAAARLLVEQRGVSVLGTDTASIDYGPAQDFPVHVLAAASNVGALENLTGLVRRVAGYRSLAFPTGYPDKKNRAHRPYATRFSVSIHRQRCKLPPCEPTWDWDRTSATGTRISRGRSSFSRSGR